MTYDLAPQPPPRRADPDEDLALPGAPARNRSRIPIETDLACVHCGYNLRGLTRKHRCPECGTPVGFSVGGDMLLYAPPAWLRALRNGMAMILWAILLGIATFANLFILPGFGYLLDLVRATLACGGVVLLTTPDPRAVISGEGFSLRRTIRGLAAGSFACAVVSFFSPLAKLALAMQNLSFLFWVANLLCLAIYLRRLADRIPDDDLERTTSYIITGFSVCLGVCVFFSFFSLLVGGYKSLVGPAPCIALAAGGCAYVFAAWFGILLFRYYSTLKWAVHEAQVHTERPVVLPPRSEL